MVRTRVGYAGGTSADPTYRAIGDHTETIQIDFDPRVIGYEELLRVFWEAHNPTAPAWSRQYMSIIHVHSDEQQALAEASKLELEARLGRSVQTVIRRAGTFYLAEFYHQKYALQQQDDLMEALAEIHHDEQALIDSTLAARLNGYVAGYGQPEQLAAEVAQLRLAQEVQARLMASAGLGAACPAPQD